MNKFKICSKCKKKKHIMYFSKRIKSKDKLNHYCKLCANEMTKKWRNHNKEKEKISNQLRWQKNFKKYRETNKKYRAKNKNQLYNKTKDWKEKNKKLISEYNKNYYALNKEKIIQDAVRRIRNKRKNNPNFKIIDNMRTRIHSALNYHKLTKNQKTINLLGCSAEEFWIHLEKQFTYGMTKENHGRNGWHIDHIVPLSSAKNQQELEKLLHYTNCRPLWAKDNLIKGNKII